MPGFGVIWPALTRFLNSTDCTGWLCPGRWSGCGMPSLVRLPVTRAPSSIRARVTHHGVQPGKAVWSAALPSRYFGITHWPRRTEIVALRATFAASTEMSRAELPIPTTTTSRPASSADER